jgi:hypothetical protein
MQNKSVEGIACSTDYTFSRGGSGSSPQERLAAAVVSQAVRDYRGALASLKRNPKNAYATKTRNECRRFFESQHFSMFCSVDGTAIMKKLDATV